MGERCCRLQVVREEESGRRRRDGGKKKKLDMGWALSTVKGKKMKGRKRGMRSGKENKEEEERKRMEIKLEEEK